MYFHSFPHVQCVGLAGSSLWGQALHTITNRITNRGRVYTFHKTGSTQSFCFRLRSRIKSSRFKSTSRIILANRPGPIVSPACSGTTVVRPSGCFIIQWLPRWRSIEKPCISSTPTTSFPSSAGKRVIRRSAAPLSGASEGAWPAYHLPGKVRWPLSLVP